MTNTEKALVAINELVDFCNSDKTNTTISGCGRIIHLVKDNVGKATFIYGEYGFDNEFYVRLDNKIKTVAIAVDNMVYVIDTYMFSEWEINKAEATLPEGVMWFRNYHKELNDKLSDEFFPQYYENLIPTKTNQWDENTLYGFARTDLLGGKNPNRGKIEKSSLLSEDDVAKILAGFVSEQSAFMNGINKNAETYDSRKSRDIATKKYIEEHKIVEDYELKLAETMRNIEAKTVIVWFEKNEKQASAKITPDSIQRVLIDRFDYYSSYNFVNGAEAKKMFSTLGAVTFGRDNDNKLYSKDIIKIMYRGKAIYQREEA